MFAKRQGEEKQQEFWIERTRVSKPPSQGFYSLSVRAFLGYGLEESTPDHSSLSVIRQRLGPEIYQGVLEVVLTALKAHGLFKGRHLGIDSSVIEANASLRTLVHRNTEQALAASSSHRIPRPRR